MADIGILLQGVGTLLLGIAALIALWKGHK